MQIIEKSDVLQQKKKINAEAKMCELKDSRALFSKD